MVAKSITGQKYGSWQGLRSAAADVQHEILACFHAETKLNPEHAEWAKQWIKAGTFCEHKAGRIGRVDEPFAVKKKSLLLTYQGDWGCL